MLTPQGAPLQDVGQIAPFPSGAFLAWALGPWAGDTLQIDLDPTEGGWISPAGTLVANTTQGTIGSGILVDPFTLVVTFPAPLVIGDNISSGGAMGDMWGLAGGDPMLQNFNLP